MKYIAIKIETKFTCTENFNSPRSAGNGLDDSLDGLWQEHVDGGLVE